MGMWKKWNECFGDDVLSAVLNYAANSPFIVHFIKMFGKSAH